MATPTNTLAASKEAATDWREWMRTLTRECPSAKPAPARRRC